MNDDKCPFCGDEFIWFRKTRCYETEIANLKAQLADREERIEQLEHWLADAEGASIEAIALTRKLADTEAKLEVWRDLADIVRTMDELFVVQKLEEMGEI